MLRSGKAPAKLGAIGILKRVFKRLREAFPKAKLRARLDGGYAYPEMFDYLEGERVEYIIAMAGNSILDAHAEPWMKRARRLSAHSAQTEHVYGECRYAAKSWSRERRVIIKAEVVCIEAREPRDNARFVVTNLSAGPKHLYENVYCQRGEIENRIKELFDVSLDRTSCTRFCANQLRVLLAAAAYVLMQELRLAARGTAWARAQVSTLRLDLLKIGVQVIASVRRLVLRLPATFPYRDGWRSIALNCGAVLG